MSFQTRRQFLRAAFVGGASAALVTAGVARADGHATNHTVKISGFTFQPAQLTIKAGDTVTFVNEDGAPHTATADNRSWDTGRLRRGASGTISYPSAGRFSYFCAVHPMMKGVITVQ